MNRDVVKRLEIALAVLLVLYLLAVGVGASFLVIANFPDERNDRLIFPFLIAGKPHLWPFSVGGSADQVLLGLAFLAGIAGSFLHAAQSLATYLGNGVFKSSWTAWYFLRPWIGGALGFAIYFVVRAGLISGANVVNPYGLMALALLGGWFSKTTTDKLQEVFETFFKTDQDRMRADKLSATEKPVIERFDPDSVAAGQNDFKIVGRHFVDGASILLAGNELDAKFESETELVVSIPPPERPAAGSSASVRVKNARGVEPLSDAKKLKFE